MACRTSVDGGSEEVSRYVSKASTLDGESVGRMEREADDKTARKKMKCGASWHDKKRSSVCVRDQSR